MKSGNHAHAQPIAIFDISSCSVAGAHILLHGDKDASVFLAQSRIDAPLIQDITMDRFVSSSVEHLQEVIKNLTKADQHHPKYIQLVLASPWYVSQTRSVVYTKETPFTCTQKLLDSLVQKEVAYMLEHDMERFGAYGKDAVVVEKQISLIKLNGYTTNQPFGKKAKKLELFLTLTIAPKKIVEQFTTTIQRAYGTKKIGLTTSPYVMFVAARDHLGVDEESVVIDVGEEITDVAFVKEGLFLYQHSFPVGTYELYRHIGEKGNTLPHEARALLEAYRLNKTSAASSKVVAEAIQSFAEVWQAALQKTLDDGHFGFCLPEQCFIVSDPRFEQIFTQIIKTDPYIQHTCSRGVVRPIFVTAELLKNTARTIDLTVPDPTLATAALFVERML